MNLSLIKTLKSADEYLEADPIKMERKNNSQEDSAMVLEEILKKQTKPSGVIRATVSFKVNGHQGEKSLQDWWKDQPTGTKLRLGVRSWR